METTTINKNLRVYDNGGMSFDRYTVARKDWREPNGLVSSFAMSDNPLHPQGFGQHSSCSLGNHLGKRISFSDLPEQCQRASAHFNG